MAIVPNLAGTTPTDLKLASANRRLTNLAAVVAATPLYPGELVADTATEFLYRGQSVTAGDWLLVTVSK